MIHSIDKESTAKKVSDESFKQGKIQNILLQVNTSQEENKFGCPPEKAEEICSKIIEMPNVRLEGLMTIGPFTDNKKHISECFKNLRKLKESISKSLSINLRELSMGMSDDYEEAIKEGSTIIRVGTAIFGKRDYT
jgi:pyridoxal phosphate enzyme (YggS family)